MTAEPDDRIPGDVKQELRRRSGYGCCRCGFPVIQYHHIILRSVEAHNRPDDMMTLCPTCHDMATKGAFTMEDQRAFQRGPFNIKRGYVAGALVSHQTYPGVQIGGMIIVGDGPLIVADDEVQLSLRIGDNGRVLLSSVLRDKDDRTLALIEDNEWISGDETAFDLLADHQKLQINYRNRGVALKLDMRGEPIQMRARFWRNGLLADLTPTEIGWGLGGETNMGMADLGLAGMSIHLTTNPQTLGIRPDHESGIVVSEADPLQRLIQTRNSYREIIGASSKPTAYQVSKPRPSS